MQYVVEPGFWLIGAVLAIVMFQLCHSEWKKDCEAEALWQESNEEAFK